MESLQWLKQESIDHKEKSDKKGIDIIKNI